MAPGHPAPKHRVWPWLAFAPALLLVGLALRPIWDVDVFWHIAAGRWIIDTLSFPNTDIFTFVDPPRDWVTFQWGYEVICAWIDSHMGLFGIRILHAGVAGLAAVAFAIFALGYLRTPSPGRPLAAIACFVVALLVTLYADRIRARPHVFNLLFWSLSLHVLMVLRNSVAIRSALLALIVFVWSNLHAGGSFIFLTVLLAWPVAATLRRFFPSSRWQASRDSLRTNLLFFAVALVAALLSPNWLKGTWQAYAMLGGSEQFIEEWLPFWHYLSIASHPLHYLAGLAPLAGLGLVILVLRSGKQVPLESLLVALGATLLPFRSARFVFYVAFTVLLLSPYLPRPTVATSKRLAVILGALSVMLLTGLFDYQIRVQFGGPRQYVSALKSHIDQRRFPTELLSSARRLAEDSPTPLKVFCQPNWGGFLLYHLYPDVRVLADGRGNVSTDLGTRLHFIYQFRHRPEYAQPVARIYAESGADTLVMQHPVVGSLDALTGWERVAQSPKGAIYSRR